MNRFDKIFLMFLLTIPLTISLPIRINAITILLVFSLLLTTSLVNRNFNWTFVKSPLFIFTLIQIILILFGLIYSNEIQNGKSDVERGFYILAFPFIIYQFKDLAVTASKLIVGFGIGCFTIVFFGVSYVLIALDKDHQRQIFESGHSYFSDQIFIHPVYLSIYFIFIFFFLLETLRTHKSNLTDTSKTIIAFGLLLIVALIFFLRSQMSLVIFAMLLVMYAIIVLKRRAWLVTFLLFTVALLVFLLDSSRVATFFDTYGKNVSSALDQRFSVWRGTIEGIKTAPYFGAGTGGEQQLINKGYAITGYQEGIDNSYNAHNQYLQFLARNGIPELLCFLALLFYSFRQSLKMPNYTFLMFNMAVTLIMFTESFLDVQRGIVFFYFFLCAFIYLPYESTPQPIKSV